MGGQVVAHNNTISGDGTVSNPLAIAQQGASAGQVLKWNNVSWTPADDIGFDNWGTQVRSCKKNTTLEGDGTTASPLKLASQGAANGQVLRYNQSNEILDPPMTMEPTIGVLRWYKRIVHWKEKAQRRHL